MLQDPDDSSLDLGNTRNLSLSASICPVALLEAPSHSLVLGHTQKKVLLRCNLLQSIILHYVHVTAAHPGVRMSEPKNSSSRMDCARVMPILAVEELLCPEGAVAGHDASWAIANA